MAPVTDEELQDEFGLFSIKLDGLCIIDKRRYFSSDNCFIGLISKAKNRVVTAGWLSSVVSLVKLKCQLWTFYNIEQT